MAEEVEWKDDSSLPLDKEGALPFYFLDAHEESNAPHTVYLFGKVPPSPPPPSSVCSRQKNPDFTGISDQSWIEILNSLLRSVWREAGSRPSHTSSPQPAGPFWPVAFPASKNDDHGIRVPPPASSQW